MSRTTVALVVGLAALGSILPQPCAAADSVEIVTLLPASGMFPLSPAAAYATVRYALESAPYGAITVGPTWEGKYDPAAAPYEPALWSDTVWIAKGTGTVVVRFGVTCKPGSANKTADGANAWLRTSQTKNGTLSIEGPLGSKRWHVLCACAGLPDLTTPRHGGIVLGTVPAPWGGTVALSETKASGSAHGRCSFDASYTILNAGAAASGPFVSRLALDTPPTTVASDAVSGVAPGSSKPLATTVALAPGTHRLYLVLDALNAVAETNESNNQFQVTYTLTGSCGGAVH